MRKDLRLDNSTKSQKREEKTKIANATNMLQSGELSLEQVARFSGLPLEKIQELAESFKSEN